MLMKKRLPRGNISDLPPEAVIRKPDVLNLFPVSVATWDNGVRSGKYPPPVRLAPRLVGWRLGDILQLIENSRE